MTLKEKFGELYIEKGMSAKCEKIAEDFAVDFAEWLVIQYNEDTIYSEYSTKELLEIFKKQEEL